MYAHACAPAGWPFPFRTVNRQRARRSAKRLLLVRWFDARRRDAEPLRASQGLSETLPCAGYKAWSLKGKALRGNHVARIGISAHQVHRLFWVGHWDPFFFLPSSYV